MEWGEKEAFLADLPDDVPMPLALLNAPIVWDCNAEVMQAFAVLNGSRTAVMGIGSIPLSEVVAYIQLFEVEEPRKFIHRIRLCDQIFLDWHEKKQTSRSK